MVGSNIPTYELIEWDITRIERFGNHNSKHILYIGDSISVGVRDAANTLSEYRYIFDGFATSKSLDNPVFIDSVYLFAKQMPRVDAVIFNNGLHGWHLTEDEYATYYEVFVKGLLERFGDVPVIMLLTTYSEHAEYPNGRVQARNVIAERIAERYNVPIMDLYIVAEDNKQYISDGVHFHSDGYMALAQKVVGEVRKFLV